MSKRYRLLLILINTLERLSIKYRFVNCTHPSDTDTAIMIGKHPCASYFIVNEKGITFIPHFLTMNEEKLRGDILAATVMAAADVQIKK